MRTATARRGAVAALLLTGAGLLMVARSTPRAALLGWAGALVLFAAATVLAATAPTARRGTRASARHERGPGRRRTP
ncbi:MAG: hypothetical protein KJ792_02350 [Actinobacteria bacterium]|nr:hypothetical protein [Actinomycetota bacterium]MCG2801384.1 hypothetical protein [Cellulomonas sp.]